MPRTVEQRQQLVTKFTAKGYKEEKSYPSGWASASAAMAREAVPGALEGISAGSIKKFSHNC